MMVDKFVRQLNILGMVLGHPGAYQIGDLEDIFDCQALTIKRDLQELREMGIDIHSMGKKGIKVTRRIPDNLLRMLFRQYVGLTNAKKMYDPAIQRITDRYYERSFSYFTELQTAIDRRNNIKLTLKPSLYNKPIAVTPIMLYWRSDTWILIAQHLNKHIRLTMEEIEEISSKEQDVGRYEILSTSAYLRRSKLIGAVVAIKVILYCNHNSDIDTIEAELLNLFSADYSGNLKFTVYVAENDEDLLISWIIKHGEVIDRILPSQFSKKVSDYAAHIANKFNVQTINITELPSMPETYSPHLENAHWEKIEPDTNPHS